MTIAANTSIKLNVHQPKTKAVVAAPGTAAGDDEVRIWAGANIDPQLRQSIVGGFEALHAYAQTELSRLPGTGPDVLHMKLGESEASIAVNTVPDADSLTLEVGATVAGKNQSHFLDRTFKRLRELWNENSAGN